MKNIGHITTIGHRRYRVAPRLEAVLYGGLALLFSFTLWLALLAHI